MHPEDRRQPEQGSQGWNAAQYAANGRFVAHLASEVAGLLQPQTDERILDLGCGDGYLTQSIAASGAEVLGCDKDASMLQAAQERGLTVMRVDMTDLRFHEEFHAVFSNAALHWTRNQPAVLQGVYRALLPGGRFVAEMGGLGNIASIRTALQATASHFGVDAETCAGSCFPSVRQYRELLEANGFRVESITLVPRPTRLAGGMDDWLRTFRRSVLEAIPPENREALVRATVDLLAPVLQDVDGTWWADYVRLRFKAWKLS